MSEFDAKIGAAVAGQFLQTARDQGITNDPARLRAVYLQFRSGLMPQAGAEMLRSLADQTKRDLGWLQPIVSGGTTPDDVELFRQLSGMKSTFAGRGAGEDKAQWNLQMSDLLTRRRDYER